MQICTHTQKKSKLQCPLVVNGEDDGQEELEAIQRRITAAMIRHTNQFSITLHEYHPINHHKW